MTESTSNALKLAASEVIRPRQRAGLVAGLLISVVFAAVAAPLAMLDRWVGGTIEAGKPAAVTVRVRAIAGHSGPSARLSGGSIAIARGEIPTPERANVANEVLASAPATGPSLLLFFGGFVLLGLLYTTHQRRSHRGKLLRTQAVNMALLLAVAAIIKTALLLSAMSVLIVPVAGLALLAAIVVDGTTGLALAMVASAVIGSLVPFDLGTIVVLAAQAGAATLALGERGRTRLDLTRAGVLGGIAAAVMYALVYFFATGALPTAELADPWHSAWVASLAAGPIAAALAMIAQGAYHALMGDISRNTLVDLEDLSNPLLKQIAEKSPGTWQHSLAMANMAEIAANAIGANGRLVRTGAYYHDLGKSLQPKYFIENLNNGETSPHDSLAPPVSCDAIFAHVTEGVRVARKAGLPERIIDFMHMHHGDGLLEYFWAKNLEQGNPNQLTQDHFRYPGIKPQSKETAILAICDAVEAASRTLKSSDEAGIRNLVQRIVYGKLHLGQLDESSMTMADLRKVSESLVETVKHGLHGRIEYPWQREEREEREERERTASEASPETPGQTEAGSTTMRFAREPRLDSLDAPPPRRQPPRPPESPLPGVAERPASTAPESRKPPALIVDEESASDDLERRITNPVRVVPAPELEAAGVQVEAEPAPAAHPDDGAAERGGRSRRNSGLEAWEDALEKAAGVQGATSARRPKPATIELMKESLTGEGAADSEPAPLRPERVVAARASTDDQELAPGVIVVGPPPATHPDRSSFHDAPTVARAIIPTKDAIRPSKVVTEPRAVVVPPEAFRDDTAPSAEHPSALDSSKTPPPPPRGRKDREN